MTTYEGRKAGQRGYQFDRCDDGLNWHVWTPEGYLYESYSTEAEAYGVCEGQDQDDYRVRIGARKAAPSCWTCDDQGFHSHDCPDCGR